MRNQLILENSSPLSIIPTGVSPSRAIQFSEIRSVVFDIYGTLIISAAGDISLVRDNASEMAMEAIGLDHPGELAIKYHEKIGEHQQRSPHEFPEVEIREVWRELVGNRPDLEEIALRYELTANPVWEMPNAKSTLEALSMRGFHLGIVSNAQFYTRDLISAFLAEVFDPDLMIFSYEEREGKPSRALYQKLAAALEKKSVHPDETLYIGNDMRKDIAPAQEVGFRTALFAGDKRSLRLHPELNVEPDCIVTDLSQLLEILPCQKSD